MECTLPRIRRRASLTLAALVAVWSLTALAVAGPLRLLASGAGVIDMSETGRFVLLHREGRVPHYVRLDRATGETLGLRDMRGQTRMGPGGRVFFWNPDGQFDIYRQVGTNRPSLVFDAPNPQGWYFDYDGASADGSLVVGQALREEPRAAVAAVLDTNTGGLRFLAPLEGTSGDVRCPSRISTSGDGSRIVYVKPVVSPLGPAALRRSRSRGIAHRGRRPPCPLLSAGRFLTVKPSLPASPPMAGWWRSRATRPTCSREVSPKGRRTSAP